MGVSVPKEYYRDSVQIRTHHMVSNVDFLKFLPISLITQVLLSILKETSPSIFINILRVFLIPIFKSASGKLLSRFSNIFFPFSLHKEILAGLEW